MIPGITEHTRIGENLYNGLWLNSDGSKKATLHQATVRLEEMGERTISTQVRIDGSVVPSFDGWELEWRGETFVLPTLKPQASKDNSTKNALVDLVFTSAPIHELKRYFFAEMAEVEVGTVIIDKYVASLRLSLTNFVSAFNKVLSYYFPDGSFVMNLNPSYQDSGEVKEFDIDYLYIWDVLVKINEVYGVTWKAVTNQQGVTVIRVGYDSTSIENHIFEYGFNGGLLRFERHVEDTDIYNVLLGRGGEKNLPYRYFKDTDQYNPIWNADPDAIPELSTVYFSRLLDSNFRKYVQGWKTNPNRTLPSGGSLDTYDATRAETDWAYKKGHTDTKFDPVEYVKDDDSVATYGIRQGKLDDNDEIYPTIQGVYLDNLGRADEVVDVYVTDEESTEAQWDIVIDIPSFYLTVENENSPSYKGTATSSDHFTVPDGRVGRMEFAWDVTPRAQHVTPHGTIDTTNSRAYAKVRTSEFDAFSNLIPGGVEAYCEAGIRITKDADHPYIDGKFGLAQIKIHCTPKDEISYRQVFTIWIKNIWESTQGDESDLTYAHRIWDPILGDRIGNSAAVHFSDGWMSTSADYEFLIQKLPEVDRTKTITTTDEDGNTITVQSEWKITLVRSDAEYEATGLYIPNTQSGGTPVAGNHFFFTGIDMPFQYVKWAEEKLTSVKESELPNNAQTNPTWIVGLDKVRAHTLQNDDYGVLLADRLDAGVVVTITDPRFTRGSDGEQSALELGIRTVTFTWSEPSGDSPNIVPDIEIVLSDKILYEKSYESVKNDIYYIENNYTTAQEVKNIAKRTKAQAGVGIDGNICYFGHIIGSVEE